MSDLPPATNPPERGGDLTRIKAHQLPIPTTPPTSPSASPPPLPVLKSLDCLCQGAGALLMDSETATAMHLVVLDTYAGRVLVPCDCTDGRARAEKWRNLPREADGVYLTSGRQLPPQQAARMAIAQFVARPRGWLTLIGGYGVGKTRLIYACLNHLADTGVYGRYVMMPALLNELRDAQRSGDYGEKLRRFLQAPVLAIDELDKLRDTDFVDDVLYAIFLERYQERDDLATIIGYNADGIDRIPAFIRSRIDDSRFTLLDLGGRDLRPIADKLDPWDRGEGRV